MSLNSARGMGKGFFSLSTTSPEEGGEGTATVAGAGAGAAATTTGAEKTRGGMAAAMTVVSPASLVASPPPLDELEAVVSKVTGGDDAFLAAMGGNKNGSSVVSFDVPPSPGGD